MPIVSANELDTIIVGAGLSGLSIASHLEAQGRSYTILEARDRVGGRILSHDGFDFGPAWFWPWHERMRELVNRVGLEYYEQQDEGPGLYQTHQGVQQLPSRYAGISYRVEGGLGALVDRMLDRTGRESLVLNARVQRVVRDVGNGRISVSYRKNGEVHTLSASRLVLAVPPRIVDARIQIEPALPKPFVEELRDVPTWMAGHAKVVVEYKHPFWRDGGFSGTAFSQIGPLGQIHDASQDSRGRYALMGFFGLPASVRRELSEPNLKSSVLHQLTNLFGAQAQDANDVRVVDWAQEPDTTTSLDLQPLAQHPKYGLSSHVWWDGRLVFAPTEVAPENGGFLEGALEASEMAAEALDLPLVASYLPA